MHKITFLAKRARTDSVGRKALRSRGALILALLVVLSIVLFAGTNNTTLAAPVPGTDVTYTLDADFDQGTLLNVNHNSPNNNQLQLNDVVTTFPFVWIALSGQGTIVKVDTETGAILGEYLSAPDGRGRDPSRTTVDLDGNVWAGNRGESANELGSAIHIGLQENNGCVDRNGNSVIDTSTGLDDVRSWLNPGGVDDDGGVSSAEDECIINYVRVNGRNTRTVAVNADNDAWIGGYNFFDEFDHDLVHPTVDGNGTLLESINPGCGGYGGLIDGNGVLWSADLSFGRLLRYDPATDTATCLLANQSYGLGIDPAGNIWNSGWCASVIYKFSPAGALLATYPLPDGCHRGVVVSPFDSNVWVANSTDNSVTRLANDGTQVAVIPAGNTPTGVAVDAAGKIWVTNLGSDNAMRIDPATNSVDLTVYLGAGSAPYNYSDMTGVVSLGSTAPQGTWTVVQDGGMAGTLWGTITWNTEPQGSEPPGTSITVEARAADTEAGLGSQSFIPVGNGVDFSLVGRFIEVKATLVPDAVGTSPVLSDIRVQIANEPPDCSAAGPSVDIIWPPNHRFVPIQVLGVSDPDGDPVSITVTSIFQDEPVDTYGDGRFTPDGMGVDTSTAEVRAERSGTKKVPGNGRVYHISFTADDGQGGACSGEVLVGVPHDQGGDPPVDDGALYDSTALSP
jgi:streptogramin lyase